MDGGKEAFSSLGLTVGGECCRRWGCCDPGLGGVLATKLRCLEDKILLVP